MGLFSKGGGGVNTAGLEQATRDATALQKQMYEEGRQDIQPWYQMGTGAVSRLSDLLGIGGGSMQTRGQLMDTLKPQYTTTTPVTGNMVIDNRTGQVFNLDTYEPEIGYGGNWVGSKYASPELRALMGAYEVGGMQTTPEMLKQYGFDLMSPAGGGTTTDYDALNAAIDAQMAEQQTPSDYGSLLQRFGMDQYEEDPGYQFRKQEAEKALERQMAAQGVTLGGGGYGEINPQAYRAMQELNQGLASQEYGNAYNRYVNDQLNTFNMLMGASGMGQSATNQMAGLGQSYATNVGNLTTGLASAQMNAQMAQASRPSMFSQLLSAGAQLGSAYLMSDVRKKENIEYVGMNNGHKMYRFNYKGDLRRFEGVMAQDVIEYMPEAIHDVDGILHVNYSLLGVDMREV